MKVFSAGRRRHLLIAFRHFDAMLAEALTRIGAAPGESMFEPHRNDADLAMHERAQEAAARAREAIRTFMTEHDLIVQAPEVAASHAARAMLALMLVEATELRGHHLRGYGELMPEEIAELDGLSTCVRECIAALDTALP